MAAAAAASMGVVREVLGADVVEEVDQPIIEYIPNVLADEDFDFGPPDGHGIFDALVELLIDAGCVSDEDHCIRVAIAVFTSPNDVPMLPGLFNLHRTRAALEYLHYPVLYKTAP